MPVMIRFLGNINVYADGKEVTEIFLGVDAEHKSEATLNADGNVKVCKCVCVCVKKNTMF